MKVSIKNLNVNMELGNNGIEVAVYDNQDQYLGDLRIGKATLEWCKGKTRPGNGNKVNWNELIKWFETQK